MNDEKNDAKNEISLVTLLNCHKLRSVDDFFSIVLQIIFKILTCCSFAPQRS